ncbi:unnamed protein product, partial [Laminaria digitata]
MELQLPVDVIYAPRVKVRVYDTRLGGFSRPLVGSGRIELGKKLPWSPDYEPPLAKTFARDGLLRAILADDGVEFDPDAAPPPPDGMTSPTASAMGRGSNTGTPARSDLGSMRSGRSGRSTRSGLGGLRLNSVLGSDLDSDEDEDFDAQDFEAMRYKRGESGFGGGGLNIGGSQ